MLDPQVVIAENKERKARLEATYNPFAGDPVLSPVERLPITIDPTAKNPNNRIWYLPKVMIEQDDLLKEAYDTHQSLIDLLGEEKMAEIWTEFKRYRVTFDFEYWCATCVRIVNKLGQIVAFILNKPQLKILARLEPKRLAGELMRLDVLKHRQFGATTLTMIYAAYLQWYIEGHWDSLTTGHQKDLPADILSRYEMVGNYLPKWARPWEHVKRPGDWIAGVRGASNIRQIPARGCKVVVGTNQNPQGPAGLTPKIVHVTDIGKFSGTPQQSAAQTIANIESMLVNAPNSLGIREGTAKASIGQYWRDECDRASKGQSSYDFCFVAWCDDETLVKPVPDSEVEDFIRSWSYQEQYTSPDYEEFLWRQGATIEQIAWYRNKRWDYDGHWLMQEDFPTTHEEAFQASKRPVFSPEYIAQMRDFVTDPVWEGELETKDGKLQDITFVEKQNGPLKVWKKPGTGVEIPEGYQLINRYVIGFDVGGGTSTSSSYNAIKVWDLAPIVVGGKPETVALYHARKDVDQAAWAAVQLAVWYENGVLIPERNALAAYRVDQEGVFEEDRAIAGIDLIESNYRNLYMDEVIDKVTKQITYRAGFWTDGKTRQFLITSYNTSLREQRYEEHDQIALDEATTFIRHENGKELPDVGKRSDVLFATMLVNWYVFSYHRTKLPQLIPLTPEPLYDKSLMGHEAYMV